MDPDANANSNANQSGINRSEQSMTPALGHGGGEGAQATQHRPQFQFGTLEQSAIGQLQQPQQQPQVPMPMMGQYYYPPMFQQAPNPIYNPNQFFQQPNVGIVPQEQLAAWAAFQAAQQSQSSAPIAPLPRRDESEKMEIDDEAMSAKREPARSKGKQKEREPVQARETSSAHAQLTSYAEDLRLRLIQAGIDTDALNCLRDNDAVVVIGELMAKVESLEFQIAQERSRTDMYKDQAKSERKRAHPTTPEQQAGPSSRPAKQQFTEEMRLERTNPLPSRRDPRQENDRDRDQHRSEERRAAYTQSVPRRSAAREYRNDGRNTPDDERYDGRRYPSSNNYRPEYDRRRDERRDGSAERRSERRRSPAPARERRYETRPSVESRPASVASSTSLLPSPAIVSRSISAASSTSQIQSPAVASRSISAASSASRQSGPVIVPRTMSMAPPRGPLDVAVPRSQKENPATRQGSRRPITTYLVPGAPPVDPDWALMPRLATPVVAPQSEADEGPLDGEEEESSSSESDSRAKRSARAKRAKGRNEHRQNLARKAENEDAGPIPRQLEVAVINNRRERSNRFWHMHGIDLYWSSRTNIVYAAHEAHRASTTEVRDGATYEAAPSRLYAIVPRGFPMNPREVSQLFDLVFPPRSAKRIVSDEERYQGYLLLIEFERITCWIHPELRDNSMRAVINHPTLRDITGPPQLRDRTHEHPPVYRPEGALVSKTTSKTRGAGLPPVQGARVFDQEIMAQYIVHHGRPGTRNNIHGIAMDHAHRIRRETVFGHSPASILAPVETRYRTAYVRVLTSIMIRPFFYQERVDAFTASNPVSPFQPITGGEFMISRFVPPEDRDHINQDMVILHLIVNRVPIDWINHCYTYATYWWTHSWPVEGDALVATYRSVEAQRQERVARLGVPPMILQYSGWRYATIHDRTRILILEDLEERDGLRAHVDAQWLHVGAPVELDHIGPETVPATSTTVAAPASTGAETIVDPTATSATPSTMAAVTASPALPANTAGEEEQSSTASMEDVRMGD